MAPGVFLYLFSGLIFGDLFWMCQRTSSKKVPSTLIYQRSWRVNACYTFELLELFLSENRTWFYVFQINQFLLLIDGGISFVRLTGELFSRLCFLDMTKGLKVLSGL